LFDGREVGGQVERFRVRVSEVLEIDFAKVL